MIELAEEEGDESVLKEVDKDLSEAEKEIEEIRLRTLSKVRRRISSISFSAAYFA